MSSAPPGGLPASAPPPAPPPRAEAARVPVWVPFAVLVAVIVIVGIIGVAVVAVLAGAGLIRDATNPPDSVSIALTLVQDAGFVIAAWVAVRITRDRATPADFGLRRVAPRRALAWAAGLYAAFWLVSAILLAIFGQPPEQEIVRELKRQDAFAVLTGYAVLTCIVAPIAEEFFFRGFMFSVLTRRLGAVTSAIVVGGVFGLVHAEGAPALGVAVLTVFGVALCALYARTGSIIPCMALHALHNSISFASTKGLPVWGFAALATVSVGAVVTAAATAAGRTGTAVGA